MRFAVVLLLFASAAHAAELRSVEVDYEEGRYLLESVVWFDADQADVYHVFRHWDYSPRFSSAIVEAHDIEPDADGRPGFYVQNRGCALFFCVTLERTGWVEAEPNRELRAHAYPEKSDFVFSDETWQFDTENGGTVVSYRLHMQPAFWVPPGIGPWVIKRKLKNHGGDAIERIEAIARGLPDSR